LITTGSSMHAMMRIAARRSIGVRAPALAAIALRLPRPALATDALCDLRTVGREHTVVVGEVHPPLGHQRGQPRQKTQRLEHKVCGGWYKQP